MKDADVLNKRSAPKIQTMFALALLLLFALLPLIAAALENPFLLRVGMRVMVLAIAVSSLNIILGYGGMVSLGHAAFVGIAAYVVAILNWHTSNGEPLLSWPFVVEGTASVLVVFPVAVAVSALAALIIGIISLRTSGLYFIMITLAFAQMLFYLFISMQKYGGEDGTQLLAALEAGSMSLSNRLFLYYIILALLIGILFAVDRVVGSRFGRVLHGCKQNERRLAALGYPTLRYKLAAFVLAGALAGVAGVLLAASQQYVSPTLLSWTRSGELVIMLVLGGAGTVFGPLFGSLFYVVLELLLGTWTTHWQIIFGPVFILTVLATKGGISGFLGTLKGRSRSV